MKPNPIRVNSITCMPKHVFVPIGASRLGWAFVGWVNPNSITCMPQHVFVSIGASRLGWAFVGWALFRPGLATWNIRNSG